MRTPSEKVPGTEPRASSADKLRPRSVFANFRAETAGAFSDGQTPGDDNAERRAACGAPAEAVPPAEGERRNEAKQTAPCSRTLQTSIDSAIARSFIYRLLAKAFEDPTAETWDWLGSSQTRIAFSKAVECLDTANRVALSQAARLLGEQLNREALEAFKADYLAAFGHAARGLCPINEIEYGDLKADPLFQPHRLADLGAFYSAFGLEVSPDAAERQDHICLELEFMAVLAAKETYALEHQWDDEPLALCREAQRKFLREHLGRWTPAFTRRLARMVGESALGALADFTREFIAAECACFDLTPGSEDLLLRPVDAAAESLCSSCGLGRLPPGAATPAAEV